MPQPAIVDLKETQGDTFRQAFTILSGGEPLDLEGSTVASALWNPRTDETIPLVVAVEGPGQIVLSWADPPPEWGKYRYDVEQTDPEGNVRTWISGLFNIRRDVTHV